MKVKVVNLEVISCINSLNSFVGKDYRLPYELRRAIKKNTNTLLEEYKIYKEELDRISEEITEPAELEKAKIKLLNTEIEIELIKLPVNILSEIDMSYQDEKLLEFMLIEE